MWINPHKRENASPLPGIRQGRELKAPLKVKFVIRPFDSKRAELQQLKKKASSRREKQESYQFVIFMAFIHPFFVQKNITLFLNTVLCVLYLL